MTTAAVQRPTLPVRRPSVERRIGYGVSVLVNAGLLYVSRR